jgi:hypothetical protein
LFVILGEDVTVPFTLAGDNVGPKDGRNEGTNTGAVDGPEVGPEEVVLEGTGPVNLKVVEVTCRFST